MINKGKNISLKDACKLIGASKDLFAPIKEAVTNAFDSIVLRKASETGVASKIAIKLYFIQENALFDKKAPILESIAIEDNGIGFTAENLFNFQQLASTSKGLNNRETGIIQVFCRFDKVKIDSIFKEQGKTQHLLLSWEATNGEYEEKKNNIPEEELKTIVTMTSFSGDAKDNAFYSQYLADITSLKKDILKNFLLRMWLAAKNDPFSLTITTYLNNEKREEYTFSEETLPVPDKKEVVVINTEQATLTPDQKNPQKMHIEWKPVPPQYELNVQRFKVPSDELDSNGVYMCSKGIAVAPFSMPFLDKKRTDFNGYRYLTSVQGSLLDNPEYVKQSVDGFLFPSKKEVEKDIRNGNLFNQEKKYVLADELKKKIGNGLEHIYADVLDIQKDRFVDIKKIADKYGISTEDVEATTGITLNDTDEEVTEKLFQTQAKRFAERSIEINKTYEEIKSLETQQLDPTSTEYRDKFEELSNKLLTQIPEQNKDELARYIIRRDMVVDLLQLALQNGLSVQKEWEQKEKDGISIRKDQEGLVHDILFKRRQKGIPNDLWVLNEEFVHFEGFSDLPLEQLEINGQKILRDDIDIQEALWQVGIDTSKNYEKARPDIFLYPEEGKCILIELKAPSVNLADCCDQIQKYAKLLANFSKPQYACKQFYGFLIGENVDLVPDRYKKSPYGKYWIYPSEPINNLSTGLPIADIYQEIIQLSGLVDRARMRNQSFAEKLGIENPLDKGDN